MSTVTTDATQNNILIANYDNSKTFIWNNRFQTESYNNDTYADITIAEGTVMGRVTATGVIKPLESTASDGSQQPVGILNRDYTVVDGDVVSVDICVAGDVAEEKLVFENGTDTVNTIVGTQRIKDHLLYLGIILKTANENTIADNQ